MTQDEWSKSGSLKAHSCKNQKAGGCQHQKQAGTVHSSCSLKHQAGDEMWNSTTYGGVRQEQSHTSNNHSRGPRQEGIKLKANPQDMGKGGT